MKLKRKKTNNVCDKKCFVKRSGWCGQGKFLENEFFCTKLFRTPKNYLLNRINHFTTKSLKSDLEPSIFWQIIKHIMLEIGSSSYNVGNIFQTSKFMRKGNWIWCDKMILMDDFLTRGWEPSENNSSLKRQIWVRMRI